MKHILLYGFFLLFLAPLIPAQKVISIKIDGTINPSSAAFIKDGIKKAENAKAECLLIHLNTPGGLLRSTRIIVSEMLESDVPVVVFVSPAGAHAGSAGVFITLAAHIAAMAPGTNIGAAHPVSMQSAVDSTMSEKATNDAAAFIRSIAARRNRNIQWAENAVRRSYSYAATEALEDSVIDMIASNETELLSRIDGMRIAIRGGSKVLQTKEATIENHEMGFMEKFLDVISDPNITYILFLLGLYGLLFELYSPGAIFPGIIGVISLVLAFYSMNTLPINYAGLALIIFAIILFLLEIKIVSHGLLAIGGAISLLLGSLMLIRPASPWEFVRISRTVIIVATIFSVLFFMFIVGMGLKAQRRPGITGLEGLIGGIGEVTQTLSPNGFILIHGETWNAESIEGHIEKGTKVRVIEKRGPTLFVETVISNA